MAEEAAKAKGGAEPNSEGLFNDREEMPDAKRPAVPRPFAVP
jgi:hypothetical protein